MTKETGGLRKKIIDEMTVNYSNALEKNFDLAKQFIRITQDGKVDLLHKEKFGGKEQILLYLIGKLYAKEGGLIEVTDVSNKELMDELGIPQGSILPGLKYLRDSNRITQVKKGKFTHHSIAINMIEKILNIAEKKLKKSA